MDDKQTAAAGNPLFRLLAAGEHRPGDPGVVKRALEAIRAHLGMDVAYVSEFSGERAVFREVDAPGLEAMIKPGNSVALDDVYCRHILAGRLPELMPDTAAVALAAAMPITTALPIGKHMSVPIRLADGSIHGMFCCLGFAPDRSLQERDLQMMRVFADLAGFEIGRAREAADTARAKQERIRKVIDDAKMSIVYQPIWELGHVRPIGFECLTRFSAEPARSPDKWFAEAAEMGLGLELELTAIRMGLSALAALPSAVYLAVNASPETILSGELPATFAGLPAERIVLEVTEHATVPDYESLRAAVHPLRAMGVRLAVDDAGAGYASLAHILQLQPDIIKLDMSLTQNIDLDPARRALAAALVGFARDTGAKMTAEGVETDSELRALRAIGVEKAQGYLLGRPAPFADALGLVNREAPAAARVA